MAAMGAEESRALELTATINEWLTGRGGSQEARDRAIAAALAAYRRGEPFEDCVAIGKEAFESAEADCFHRAAREWPVPPA